MKFNKVLVVTFFTLACLSINAQVFVGGNISFNSSNSNAAFENTDHKTSNWNFELTPAAGKFLNENLALGIALTLGNSRNRTENNIETISKSSSFGVTPFLRYYAVRWKKFSVYGQGYTGIKFSNSSRMTSGTTTDRIKTTSLSAGFFPGLSYDLNNRISFETSLNFLNISYGYYNSRSNTIKDHGSSFNIGAGIGNIITVGAISIGAIFKF